MLGSGMGSGMGEVNDLSVKGRVGCKLVILENISRDTYHGKGVSVWGAIQCLR